MMISSLEDLNVPKIVDWSDLSWNTRLGSDYHLSDDFIKEHWDWLNRDAILINQPLSESLIEALCHTFEPEHWSLVSEFQPISLDFFC